MIEDHNVGKLDETIFPYVKDSPALITAATSLRSPPPTTSLRSAKPSWHQKPRAGAGSDNRQRIIVFVAGGVTYSELRETYQLSNSLNKDIYIGMSSFSPQTTLTESYRLNTYHNPKILRR